MGRPGGLSAPGSGVRAVPVMLASPFDLVVAFGRVAARTLLPVGGPANNHGRGER